MPKGVPRCPYRLCVVRGVFTSDYWSFESIEAIDEWIVKTRQEGSGALVLPGTMEIRKGREVVGFR